MSSLGVLRGMFRRPWLLIAIAVLASLSFAGVALGLEPPHVTVQASATQVEVGEPFTIELKATSEAGSPEPMDGDISPPRDLSVVSTNEVRQQFLDRSGGRAAIQSEYRVIWQLVAQRPGRFTIPAPTVHWSSHRLTGTAVTVEVVPATGRPRRQQQQNNPFLMPGGPGFSFTFPFRDLSPDDDVRSQPRTAPELALPAAPDPSIFVHVKVDKKSAVVGEQITLSVYIYHRPGRPPALLEQHDTPLADFLRMPLVKSPGTEQPVLAMVGGERYVAELFDQMAIFPLHAGELHIGQARYAFRGAARAPMERSSEDQVIHVTEPPRAGRPVGYTLGDVGQFTLSASVDPKRIDQGSEVAVRLRLAGTGNLPQSLRVPARTGVEWLDPEKKESIEPQAGVIGGWRTFGYVVRVKESGSVDLGEVTLPFWDPTAQKYQEARAVLGKIQVTPTPPAVDPVTKQLLDPPAPDPFTAMPAARAALGPYTPPRPRLVDGGSLWLLIAAPPLLVGVVSMGADAARRARTRRAAIKDSPAALAEKALDDARRAGASGDGKALAAALERALHLSVEAATGLKSRGVLVADLPEEIEQRGLPRALGDEIAGAFAACEAVRFDPSPDDRVTRDLGARVRAIVTGLRQAGSRWGLDPQTPGAT